MNNIRIFFNLPWSLHPSHPLTFPFSSPSADSILGQLCVLKMADRERTETSVSIANNKTQSRLAALKRKWWWRWWSEGSYRWRRKGRDLLTITDVCFAHMLYWWMTARERWMWGDEWTDRRQREGGMTSAPGLVLTNPLAAPRLLSPPSHTSPLLLRQQHYPACVIALFRLVVVCEIIQDAGAPVITSLSCSSYHPLSPPLHPFSSSISPSVTSQHSAFSSTTTNIYPY